MVLDEACEKKIKTRSIFLLKWLHFRKSFSAAAPSERANMPLRLLHLLLVAIHCSQSTRAAPGCDMTYAEQQRILNDTASELVSKGWQVVHGELHFDGAHVYGQNAESKYGRYKFGEPALPI